MCDPYLHELIQTVLLLPTLWIAAVMFACYINHLAYSFSSINTTAADTTNTDIDTATATAAALATLCAEELHALEEFEEVRAFN